MPLQGLELLVREHQDTGPPADLADLGTRVIDEARKLHPVMAAALAWVDSGSPAHVEHEKPLTASALPSEPLEVSSLEAYWDFLNSFDWAYQWSDDHGVYEEGRKRLAELRALAALSPRHAELFLAFEAHHSARNYGLPQVPPKPQRPRIDAAI